MRVLDWTEEYLEFDIVLTVIRNCKGFKIRQGKI